MPVRELGKLGLRYLGWYLLFVIALTVLGHFWEAVANASLGFVVTFSAAMLTLEAFVKNEQRLPSREEYWALVLVSTAIGLAVDSLSLLLITSVGPRQELPIWGWLIIFFIATAMGVLANMFGYSKWFGRSVLKRMADKKVKQTAKAEAGK